MENVMNLTEEWLNETHHKKIVHFNCTDADGDNHVALFLQKQAEKLMRGNLVRTRLFFDESQNLIGFYSLFNDTIKMNKHKRNQLTIHLPQNVREIPAIRLHYIGVDERMRGRGYGNFLMASAIVKCAIVAKNSGCTLITLEATESVRQFYEKFDFTYVHKDGSHDIMAMNTKHLIDLV